MSDDTPPGGVWGSAPDPPTRLADVLLAAILATVRSALAAGDTPAQVLADVLSEAPEVAGVLGLPEAGATANAFRRAFGVLVGAAIEHVQSRRPEPPTLEESGRRLLAWMFDFSLKLARERLAAGDKVRDVVSDLVGDRPAAIAAILRVPPDSPDRGDFERDVKNLIEDAVWLAARSPINLPA